MKKLTKKDIRILGEGPQIRKYIKERYKDLEEFFYSSDIPITLSTLRTYLSRDVILSDTFKCGITKALDMDYNKLALSPKEQVKKHVFRMYENIVLYNEKEDLELMDELLEMCKQMGLSYETAMMYRAKAKNHYFRNKINRAEEYYGYAIDAVPQFEGDLLVSFHTELADAYFRENMLSKSEKQYQLTEELVYRFTYKLTNKPLFRYYYCRGLLYLHTDRFDSAREYFKSAADYAARSFEKAAAIANIGLTYKRQKNYQEVLNYYQEALNHRDESRLATTGVIYNNMSEMYRCLGDYRNAQIYVHKAMEMNELDYSLINHLACVETYVEIQMELGSYISFDKYFDILRSTKDKQIDKLRVVRSIKAIIRNTNNKIYLKQLANVMYELMDASDNSNFIQGLHECFGQIYIKFDILNGERSYEKFY